MSLSGVTTFELTGEQLVNAAMRKIGVLAKAQVADAEDILYGIQAANVLIAELQTKGMQLWKRVDTTLTMVASTNTYTLTQPNKPSTILYAYLQDTTSGSKIPVEQVAYYDFTRLPETSTGMPIKYTYQPGIMSGTVKLWPTPSTAIVSNKALHIVKQDEMQIIVSNTDTFDVSREWYGALIYGLALSIAPEYAVPLPDRQLLNAEYDKHITTALDGGSENVYIRIQPNTSYAK